MTVIDQTTEHMSLTCKNHPRAKYLTKRIPGRSLHFIEADPDYVRQTFRERGEDEALAKIESSAIADQILGAYPRECPCPASDLIEIPYWGDNS